jgi:hypothetical protein
MPFSWSPKRVGLGQLQVSLAIFMALPLSLPSNFFLQIVCARRRPIYSQILVALFLSFPSSSEARFAVSERICLLTWLSLVLVSPVGELGPRMRVLFVGVLLAVQFDASTFCLFVCREPAAAALLVVEPFRWWRLAGCFAGGVVWAGQRKRRRVEVSLPHWASRSFLSARWRFRDAFEDKIGMFSYMPLVDLLVIFLLDEDASITWGTFCSQPLFHI